MVAEEGDEAYGKHCGHEENKENMEPPPNRRVPVPTPKVNEVSERECEDYEAVEERIAEKENEELVVVETDAVVHC